MRAYLIVALFLLLIFGSIFGYLFKQSAGRAGQAFTPPPITIAATTAHTETWPSQLDAVGTIRATRGAELSAETSGEIIAIRVPSGAEVQAGQLLLTLNDSVEQASRKRQEANLILARLLYKRDASLVKKKSIPQSQYDRSQANLDSAIAQLAETEARLANKRIVAPFKGTVGIIQVKVGDYIESGTPITTLQDLGELEIDFAVPARHFPQLRKGLSIAVYTAAFPGREFRATLRALDARVDANTRNLMLRATMDDSDGLLPGMFARLIVDLGNPITMVAVPETAVSYSLHGNIIYVIQESDGELQVQPRVVQTGDSRGGKIAIIDGLHGGERVVTAGQNKLRRGARVVIDESVKF
ncbi:MAG: efflux transporter periplasmic adaptor subunit [Gammaproteobacteria bacterium]|nr:MAG: efflux transporter periplasmic adaptor subunit [Gammaproteobacteria bacterium]